MSGHSKWATIKRQKGANDAKRGQQFTKLSHAITIAVRQGGGITDTSSNFKLRLAVDKARSFNMPKDNIERAIERAAGKSGVEMVEALYEGFAPGGVAIIVEAVTDNKQRTVSEVKNIFDKNGGTLGNQGSVSYLFERVGEVITAKNGKSTDDLMDMGLNAGVQDLEDQDGQVIFYTDPSLLYEVKNKLENQGVVIEAAELSYKPLNYVQVSEDIKSKIENLLEKLEDLDDVQSTYSNYE